MRPASPPREGSLTTVAGGSPHAEWGAGPCETLRLLARRYAVVAQPTSNKPSMRDQPRHKRRVDCVRQHHRGSHCTCTAAGTSRPSTGRPTTCWPPWRTCSGPSARLGRPPAFELRSPDAAGVGMDAGLAASHHIRPPHLPTSTQYLYARDARLLLDAAPAFARTQAQYH